MSDDEDLNRAFIVVSDDDAEEPTDRDSKRQRKRQTSASSTQPSSIQAVSGEVAGSSRRRSSRIPRPVATEGESSSSSSTSTPHNVSRSTGHNVTRSATSRNVSTTSRNVSTSTLSATPLRVQVRNSFPPSTSRTTITLNISDTTPDTIPDTTVDTAVTDTGATDTVTGAAGRASEVMEVEDTPDDSDEPIITNVIEGDGEESDEPVMVPNRAAAIRWQLARNVQLRLYRRGWPSRVRRSRQTGRPVVRPRSAMFRVNDRVSAVQHLQGLTDTSNDADIAARMAMDPTYSPPHTDTNGTQPHEVLLSELEASAQRLTSRPYRALSPGYRRLNMGNPGDRQNSYNSLRDRITELRRELQSLNGVLSHSYELLTQIAYQHRTPPPVTIDADFLQRAPTKLVTEADVTSEKQCSICLAHYANGETMRVLPCDHEFHEICIDRWLTSCSRTCPFCRTNIHDALSLASDPT